ncbi:MAG: CAP domain-containing protein [Bacillota bacterium]
MKKVLFILLVLVLTVSACSPQGVERRPNNQMDNMQNNAGLASKESSIYDAGEVKNCRITADSANVRLGAGNDFQKIGSLRRDEVVNVLQQIGDWYVVQLENNKVGCIKTENAVPIVKDGQNKRTAQADQPQNVSPAQPNTQTNQTENTKTAVKNPAPKLSSQAQQMVDLVNQERSKNGLSPLRVDLEVARVAEVKSQDMVDNNYFSHYSPNYGSPFDMMKSFGVEYLSAGENIAGNTTVAKAHEALMNSAGHRKNILSPDFTHIGIGVKPSDKYGLMFTQMFIRR